VGHIINKNWKFFGVYLFILSLVVTGMKLYFGRELHTLFVIIGGVLILLLVFGAIFLNEQYEEKHKGYDLLAILPLTTREIVAAKFLLVLLANAIFTGFLVLIFSFSDARTEELLAARSYILLCGCCSLVLAGILYIGILGLGYTKFLVVVLTFTTALGLVPLFIMQAYKGRMDILVEQVLAWLQGLNWSISILLVLISYLILMEFTTWVR